MVNKLVGFFLALFCLSACAHAPSQTMDALKPTGPVVYTAGWYETGGQQRRACYWKNLERHDLPGKNASAVSIFPADGHVYACGNYSSGSHIIPCYWVDERRTDLDFPRDGKHSAYAKAIFVFAGKNYVSGGITDETKTDPKMSEITGTAWYTHHTACYWADNQRTDLTGDNEDASAGPVFVDRNHVYISGSVNGGLCYWKCTGKIVEKTELPCPALDAKSANAIWATAKTVYVAGMYHGGTVDHVLQIPCLWANQTLANLAECVGGNTSGVCVDQDNVYVSGYYSNQGEAGGPCYWKDAQRIQLPTDKVWDANTNGICVKAGTVYVAGYRKVESRGLVPCYWAGGQYIDLPAEEGKDAMATAIAVAMPEPDLAVSALAEEKKTP